MNSSDARKLVLESLQAVPVVEQAASFYRECCMVCFDNQGHTSGVGLGVEYRDSNEVYQVYWSGDVTDRLKKARADLVDTVRFAAEAITFLLVPELIGLTTIEQAVRGTGIDYYLGPKDQDDILIFNRAARLEISGILVQNEGNTVDGRIKEKLDRLAKHNDDLPGFVSVVEFSRPWSKMVEA